MKKIFWLGLLVLLAVGIIAGAVYAQTQTPPNPQPGYGTGRMGGMRGGMWQGQSADSQAVPFAGRPEWSGYSDELHDLMASAYAAKLGISVDDLNKALAAGKTMAQVAQEKGISAEQFTAMMKEAHTQALAEAVKKGLITQQQADWMNQRTAQMAYGPENCWAWSANGAQPENRQPAAGMFGARRGGMRGPLAQPTAVPAP
jgi:hypothetical protein